MTQNGKLWEQTTWVRGTEEKEFGLWPTPCASSTSKWDNEYHAKMLVKKYQAKEITKTELYSMTGRKDVIKEMMSPTPTGTERSGTNPKTGRGEGLSKVVKMTLKDTHSIPTPTASDHIKRESTSTEKLNFATNKTVSLDRWVEKFPDQETTDKLRQQMFPTPQANEDAAGTPQGKMQRMLGNCEEVRDSGTGVLNPTWVEWLMGYPSGWTDLKVSETQLSRTSPISSESDLKNYAKKTKPKNISPKP